MSDATDGATGTDAVPVTVEHGDGETTRLSEKPEAIGRLAAMYNPGLGPNATVEAVYSGVAYSPTDDDFARLDPSLVLNVRAGYRLAK